MKIPVTFGFSFVIVYSNEKKWKNSQCYKIDFPTREFSPFNIKVCAWKVDGFLVFIYYFSLNKNIYIRVFSTYELNRLQKCISQNEITRAFPEIGKMNVFKLDSGIMILGIQRIEL